MSDQERLKEIAKVASNASETIVGIIKALAEQSISVDTLSVLAYQLGYIEGLSYVPGGEE